MAAPTPALKRGGIAEQENGGSTKLQIAHFALLPTTLLFFVYLLTIVYTNFPLFFAHFFFSSFFRAVLVAPVWREFLPPNCHMVCHVVTAAWGAPHAVAAPRVGWIPSADPPNSPLVGLRCPSH